MATVLLVDDSETELALARGLLEHSAGECHLRCAGDSWEALEQIEWAIPDLVVTDLVMPEMDGLQLLRILRRRFPQLPVVLMTAYGSEQIASEALRTGAASYVPKAQRAALLETTVRQLLARRRPARSRERTLDRLARLDASFVLDNDADQIVDLVELVLQVLRRLAPVDEASVLRIGVALEEALLNALCHGNLEIDGPEYARAKEEGRLTQLVDQRRSQPPYRDRRLSVEAAVSTERCRFVMHDQGPGFASAILSTQADTRAAFEEGRFQGTTLMQHLMENVAFHDPGNEVVLQTRFARRSSRGPAISLAH